MPNQWTGRLKQLQEEALALFDDRKLVRRGVKQLAAGHHFLHFWIVVVKNFIRNRCPVRASALAYTTLLALIPMLAVGLGVSSSLLQGQGGKKTIEEFAGKMVDEIAPQLGLMPTQQAGNETDSKALVRNRIVEFVANIHSGTLGLTGTVALIFVALGLLSTIEATFNDIWGVTRSRNWLVRITQYWAVLTLGPLLLILAMGLTVGSQFKATNDYLLTVPFFGQGLITLAPFLILSGTFSLFYLLIPNTRVDWQAAVMGGVIGGLLWNINSHFNVAFASKVVSASKIYGPLGAVPVFLVGLYFSWLILLLGAQVAHAFQNRRAYLQEIQADSVNQLGREFVALQLMTKIGQRFQEGQPPSTANVLANELDIPTRLASQLLETLTHAGLLVETIGRETGYDPARPLDRITSQDILQALRVGQGVEMETREESSRNPVQNELKRIRQVEREAASTKTLQHLVNEAGKAA